MPWRGIFWTRNFISEGAVKIEALEIARRGKEALLAKKAEKVVILDVRGISSITDYYLIATGNNSPHIKALVTELEKTLSLSGVRCYRRAGSPESEWIAADYLDTVVHIFSHATRDYYALEQLWNDAKRVE